VCEYFIGDITQQQWRPREVENGDVVVSEERMGGRRVASQSTN